MLDPISVARENGLSEPAFLRKLSIRGVIKSNLISLVETALPEIAAQNAVRFPHDEAPAE